MNITGQEITAIADEAVAVLIGITEAQFQRTFFGQPENAVLRERLEKLRLAQSRIVGLVRQGE